ncbi:MAG: cyclic nucleotide-binding protein [Microcystaceae cyanobacterium]
MISKIPEKTMHMIRWGVTCGWLLLISSLFYDPVSSILTDPKTAWSPLKLNPDACVSVQGNCFPSTPYPMGASLFWGLIIPVGVLVLLVFGHEFWRRICPLSFLSQISRALGKQRQIKRKDAKTGKVRTELVKVKADSWLARNHTYLQFGFLYLGVCGRVLFFDSNRLILGSFLLFTICSAIFIGYWYAGKAWCQYFCPMAPVQLFYAEPRGLLTSIAHQGDKTSVTQSMCRRITKDGKEQSACVACQSPCVDIDAERSYWDHLKNKDYKFFYYSYAGLAIGYFLCYYFYAGNWNYLLSGAWARQPNQLAALLAPAIYLPSGSIPIPRLVFVPLFIALSCFLGYEVGKQVEKLYKTFKKRQDSNLKDPQLQHQIYTLYTFIVFNVFFVFGGRGYISKLPITLQYCFNILIVLVSTLWVYRTWYRSAEIYSREGLASRLRKQLIKLKLDVSRFLEGKSIESLNPDEVYVLAKILPGFTGEKRIQAYKGVLMDALEEGYATSANSLEALQHMRQELGISEQEHQTILSELTIERPDLFDPNQKRSKEDQLRLQSFRQQLSKMTKGKRRRGAKGLGKELLKVVKKEKSVREVLPKEDAKMRSLAQEYGITSEEEDQILADLNADDNLLAKGERLLSQLETISETSQILASNSAYPQDVLFQSGLKLLISYFEDKQKLICKGILEILEQLPRGTKTTELGLSVTRFAPSVINQLFQDFQQQWKQRLKANLITKMEEQITQVSSVQSYSQEQLSEQLMTFLSEPDSLVKALSFYLLSYIESDKAQQKAQEILEHYIVLNPLVQETARKIIDPSNFTQLSTLEKVLYLCESDLFCDLQREQLITLAYHTDEQSYDVSETILQMGQFTDKLLLLVQGGVQSQSQKKVFSITFLNYLDILSQRPSNTTLTSVSKSCVLGIEGSIFDELLTKDKMFIRQLLQKQYSQ